MTDRCQPPLPSWGDRLMEIVVGVVLSAAPPFEA